MTTAPVLTSIDDLARVTGSTRDQVLDVLATLEREGRVRRFGSGQVEMVASDHLRAGDFHPIPAKRCGCGARGEWPGRRCPSCLEEWQGVVRAEFGPRTGTGRAGRRAA